MTDKQIVLGLVLLALEEEDYAKALLYLYRAQYVLEELAGVMARSSSDGRTT